MFSRLIPKEYRSSLAVAVGFHLLLLAVVAVALSKDEFARLGPADGSQIVEVSAFNKPEPPAPAPRKEARKPEPVKKEPVKKEEKKPEPQKTEKPKPEPVKKEADPPKKEPPKKEPVKKEPEKPVIKPPPEPEKKVEEKKPERKALTPAEARKLRPVPTPKPAVKEAVSQPEPASSNQARPGQAEAETVTKSGSTTLKGLGLPEYYSRSALDKLAKYFFVPSTQQKDLEAILSCRISSSGKISNIRVQKSSGSSSLDQLAVQALERTDRFTPFPDDFRKEYVDVEIAFHFQQ